MGEKSKKIGEIGEKIVEEFFSIIGWFDPLSNQPLDCMNSKKHARSSSKKGLRETHGIDLLYSYKSQLESNTVISVLASVKNSDNAYKNNPKADFKSHIEDLAQALECYRNSELKSEQKLQFNGVTKDRDTGVIFWLSSHDDTYDDVVSKINNVRLDSDLEFDCIHIVDNKRIDFVYDVMTWLKSEFNDKIINYYYPETSLSYIDKSIKRYGNTLPVEFLTSPVLPFIIKDENPEKNDVFCIASIDGFDKDSLTRLIQAAREYTHEVTCDYLFLFPNYVPSQHEQSVIKAKRVFDKDISKHITVKSFRPDYRSLSNGK
ncbi:GapS4a family protein [Endozoicomonas numazuensis]|uniref:GAPS4 PD-(D/E)XK nuclease domain-containing protein n=1 Tax=Endozoicomonas numazuensis TaxID=1137799 RepID=A0A081NI05_9GAMM|nr:hypothetical protein [Endozoicomonas numazuensis]KEQ18078.1 hypothetical protein GZ78_10910 [Endozoicomonas numazuensis]